MEVKNYQIEITETLNRIIEIKAGSFKSALEKARNLYRHEKVVLTSEDFLEVEFKNFENSDE